MLFISQVVQKASIQHLKLFCKLLQVIYYKQFSRYVDSNNFNG